jgi:hypothetical protein
MTRVYLQVIYYYRNGDAPVVGGRSPKERQNFPDDFL